MNHKKELLRSLWVITFLGDLSCALKALLLEPFGGWRASGFRD